MNKNRIMIAAVLGALAVVLGAFGAHALKERLSEEFFRTYQTGIQYQFYHVFAICITGLVASVAEKKLLGLSFRLFVTGIILFSGSLYLLTLFRVFGYNNFDWLGIITPFGGLAFIAGWLLLAFSVYRNAQ